MSKEEVISDSNSSENSNLNNSNSNSSENSNLNNSNSNSSENSSLNNSNPAISDVPIIDNSLASHLPRLDNMINQLIPNQVQGSSIKKFLTESEPTKRFIFYGGGSNGKSTLINEIALAFPVIRLESHLREDQPNPEWSRDQLYLPGTIVVTSDPTIFRELTAGIPIQTRKLFQCPQSRIPLCSVILETNYYPDPLLLRRATLIDFPHVFGRITPYRFPNPTGPTGPLGPVIPRASTSNRPFYRYIGYAAVGAFVSAIAVWVVTRRANIKA